MTREAPLAGQTGDDLAALRANPAHWTWYGTYHCSADPRLMVRDRLGFGWTLNMAHPRAQTVIWSVLFTVVGMLAGLIALVRWLPR